MSDLTIVSSSADASPICGNAEREASLAQMGKCSRHISVGVRYRFMRPAVDRHPTWASIARLTLVEIDPRQVSRNKIAHETIVGDMQTIELPAESFDLVICYNVIEHLPRLTEALERMSRVVKRDGLVVIGAPVPNSLSGLAARFTPHLVHVWICGICSNGRMRENRAVRPFPVAYQKLVQPSALQSHARKLGLEPVYFRTYFVP
jgi:ubiquinone/menaquinone biosynthesis C-methylase UbiE